MHHSLISLSRTVRPARPGESPLGWRLLYDPTRMAGVQVLLQATRMGATLVDGRHGVRTSDRVQVLADHGVDVLSATPTLWRQLLQTPGREQLRLRQITLGGEIADQMLLDALRRAFPSARTTHVFASTETGAAFSVHDGRAGFPTSFLVEPPKNIRLEVRNGLLHVTPPAAALRSPTGSRRPAMSWRWSVTGCCSGDGSPAS